MNDINQQTTVLFADCALCPEWVLYCHHLDGIDAPLGEVVWVVAMERYREPCRNGSDYKHGRNSTDLYFAGMGSISRHWYCGCPQLNVGFGESYVGDNLDEARAWCDELLEKVYNVAR